MNEISITQAFSEAPPRSIPTILIPCEDGSTDRITAEWFTWLNLKHQPVISFSIDRETGKKAETRINGLFALAFARQNTAHPCEGEGTLRVPGFTGAVPEDAGIVLLCTIENAYNYPFGKVRIFNCNLDKAWSIPETR